MGDYKNIGCKYHKVSYRASASPFLNFVLCNLVTIGEINIFCLWKKLCCLLQCIFASYYFFDAVNRNIIRPLTTNCTSMF